MFIIVVVIVWCVLVVEGGFKVGDIVFMLGIGGVLIFVLQLVWLMGVWVIVIFFFDVKLE